MVLPSLFFKNCLFKVISLGCTSEGLPPFISVDTVLGLSVSFCIQCSCIACVPSPVGPLKMFTWMQVGWGGEQILRWVDVDSVHSGPCRVPVGHAFFLRVTAVVFLSCGALWGVSCSIHPEAWYSGAAWLTRGVSWAFIWRCHTTVLNWGPGLLPQRKSGRTQGNVSSALIVTLMGPRQSQSVRPFFPSNSWVTNFSFREFQVNNR